MSNVKLIVKLPGQPDREEVFTANASIGRAPDNTIRVDADGVSRYHAAIEYRADGFWLTDLGSRNGTTVNGLAVTQELKLQDRASISLGGTAVLEVRFVTAPMREAARSQAAMTENNEKSSGDSPGAEKKKSGVFDGKRPLWTFLIIFGVVAIVLTIAHLSTSRSDAEGNRRGSEAAAKSGSQTETPSSGAEPGRVSDTAPMNPQVPGDTTAVAAEAGQPMDQGGDADSVEIRHMAEVLAAHISGREGFEFDPALVERIRQTTPLYRNEFINDARSWSRDIKAAFNDKAVPPILGLILAISQTRSKTNSEGIWRLPPGLAKQLGYLKPEEDETVMKDVKRSSEIAAAYLKQLQDQFSGKENFIYVVACYGERMEKASAVGQELSSKDPTGTMRLNLRRMVDAKIVSDEQAERVVRFFAAGIVCENPQKFRLRSNRLDTLLVN